MIKVTKKEIWYRKMKKIAFLGAGNMAFAIVGGLGNREVLLYDKFPAQYDKFSENAKGVSSASEAVEKADIVFLSVKPQNFPELLAEIKDSGVSVSEKLFVTIAAGISTSSICSGLGCDVAVIRAMPNTPLLIGRGVTALSRNSYVSDGDFKEIFEMFSNIGYAFELPEEKMNVVIAATSSAPAYIYYIIDCIAKEARAEGLDGENILTAVCEMVKGAAEMVASSDKTPEELVRMVCSPNGTTERAMKVLYEEDINGTLSRAMQACTKRAEELSQNK